MAGDVRQAQDAAVVDHQEVGGVGRRDVEAAAGPGEEVEQRLFHIRQLCSVELVDLEVADEGNAGRPFVAGKRVPANDVGADDLAPAVETLVAAAATLIDAAEAIDESVVADVAPALVDGVVVVDGAHVLHGLIGGVVGIRVVGGRSIGVIEGGRVVDDDLLRRDVHARPDLDAVAVEAIAVGGAPVLARQELVVVERRRQAAGVGDRTRRARSLGRRSPPHRCRLHTGGVRRRVQSGDDDPGRAAPSPGRLPSKRALYWT